MRTERMQGLSDAVIAIAATIMVLELDTPDEPTLSALWTQWPIFLAHFNSFVIIYILWVNHNEELSHSSRVSAKIVLLNALWLAVVSLVPFATGWVGRYPDYFAPEMIYTLILCCCSLLYHLIYLELARESPGLKEDAIRAFTRRIPIYIGYLLSFVLAVFKPVLSMAVIFIVALMMGWQILRNMR